MRRRAVLVVGVIGELVDVAVRRSEVDGRVAIGVGTVSAHDLGADLLQQLAPRLQIVDAESDDRRGSEWWLRARGVELDDVAVGEAPEPEAGILMRSLRTEESLQE